MPCTLQAFSQDDFCWNVSFPGVGRGRSTVHGVHPFFSSFAEHQHDSVTREIVGSGKGLSKKEAIVQGKEPDTGASATAGPTHLGTDTSTTDAASGQNKSKDLKAEAKAEAKGADAKGPAEASAASGPDAETAGSGKGKAGKGKGTFDDWMKGKGKGKGGKSGYHRHGRSPHRSHSPRGRHPSLRRRKSGASKRLKHLLQRQRQMRSHSPRSVGTLHRSPSPWRYGDRLRMGSYPSKSVGSLRRSVGLLQTGTERHLSSIEHAVPSALLPWGPRRRTAEVTAFLFGIGKSADEAHRIDQETEQQEIQEEAKSVVNAESAGYDQPTGVEQGEEEEFEHEHDLEAMQSPEEMYNQPRGPGCECPAWDPLKTALPEDKQHASLVMLQRRIRPENRVAPSLREAASAVEHAGRLFEGWVRRRQQLADVLPELAVKMEYCHNRAKDFAHSAAEGALKSLQQRLEEEEEAEAATEEQAEMTEGQLRFQAIGEAQEDVNELAQQETAQQNTAQQDLAAQGLAAQSMAQQGLVQQEMHGGHYGQSAFLGQVPTGRNTRAAFQDVGQLAQAMGQIYGRPQPPPPQMPPGHDASAAAPEAAPQEAALEAPKQVEVEEEMKEEEDLEQAREVEDWGDFFRECGEFRIPPTVLAARRAANEAYWAFDRAMQVAEKKVGRAIQHSVLRGA